MYLHLLPHQECICVPIRVSVHVYTDTVPYSSGQKVTKEGKKPQAFKTHKKNSCITHRVLCASGKAQVWAIQKPNIERKISKSTKIRGKRPKKAEVKFPTINNLSFNFVGHHLHPPKSHLNQSNERRDYNGDAFGQQSRKLIAEGFSCPCGHAYKNIFVTCKNTRR